MYTSTLYLEPPGVEKGGVTLVGLSGPIRLRAGARQNLKGWPNWGSRTMRKFTSVNKSAGNKIMLKGRVDFQEKTSWMEKFRLA